MGIRFTATSLVVADMAKSLAFYRTIGLDIPPEADEEEHVEFIARYPVRLCWDTADVIKRLDPERELPDGATPMSVAFACDTPADVDEVYARMVDAGYHGYKAPWDADWGMRYAVLHDPDGVSVDLLAPLPTDDDSDDSDDQD